MYTTKKILDDAAYPYKEFITDKLIVIDKQEILYRSGDQPDSLRGLSLDGFGIDEAREFKNRDIFDIMQGRLSNSVDAQGYVCTSPKGKNWSHALESEPGVHAIVQKTSENPFLPPGYITSLRQSYTSQFASQELDADIVEFGAGIIDPSWFAVSDAIPRMQAVRFWDLAVSIKTSADYTAGALCSWQDGKIIIHDIIHGKYEYPDLRRLIIQTAAIDGPDTVIAIEEAGQQRGYIDDLKRLPELGQYAIVALKPDGDKLSRAMPWASRAQLGSVVVCRGAWNRPFFDECASFTPDDSHDHDDMIDSVSGAYQYLARNIIAGPLIYTNKMYDKDLKNAA